jgi:hypothetical protein
MQQFSRYINLCGVLTRKRGALDRQERGPLSLFSFGITKQLILISISFEGGWRIQVEKCQVVGAKNRGCWDSSVTWGLDGGGSISMQQKGSFSKQSLLEQVRKLLNILSFNQGSSVYVHGVPEARWSTRTHYSGGYKGTIHFYFLIH